MGLFLRPTVLLSMLLLACGPAELRLPDAVAARSTSGRFALPLGSSVAGFWGSAKNDIWAPLRTFTMGPATLLHFDGNTWTPITGPTAMNPRSIWGIASNEIWIAGVDADNATVVIHFDGTAWAPMAVLPFTDDNVHVLIYAASPTAVTVFRGASIQQWNGSTWKEKVLPNQYGLRTTDIAGVDREHVYFRQTDGTGKLSKWDGAEVTRVEIPSDQPQRVNGNSPPRGFHSDIASISIARDNNLWIGSNGSEVRTWDGKQTLGPVLITGDQGPFEISGVSGTANDVWIVGKRPDTTGCVPSGRGGCSVLSRALAVHFDGSTWTTIAENELSGLADAVWMDGPDSAWIAADVLIHVP